MLDFDEKKTSSFELVSVCVRSHAQNDIGCVFVLLLPSAPQPQTATQCCQLA